MTGRERVAAWAAAAVMAALVLDRAVIAPILDGAEQVRLRREALEVDAGKARASFERRLGLEAAFRDRLAHGLATTAGAAEGQVLHALREWSQESGLVLASIRPDGPARGSRDGPLLDLAFQVVGSGSTEAVARFLSRLETAAIPLRVHQVHLSSRQGTANEVGLQVRVSTLYCADAPRVQVGQVPAKEDATAWKRFEVVVERDIFSKDRGHATRAGHGEPRAIARETDPDALLILVGVIESGGTLVALLEDGLTGKVRRVEAGSALPRGRVKEVRMDGLAYEKDGQTVNVPVGKGLTGGQPEESSKVEVPGPAPAGDGGVLERLRQRRQKELGK